MLKVWGRRRSFNTQKVLWLVGEWGWHMSMSRRAAATGGSTTRIFRALNPHGRVPVVEDCQFVISTCYR
jgi:glutathione S-transferase